MGQVAWGAALFYLGLAALLTAEEAGVFLLPGDISLVAAGVYGAQGGAVMFAAWAVAAAGMVAGASIMFMGVRRHDASVAVLPRRVRVLVHRFGPWGIGLGRLVPGLRNATVFAAAASKLSAAKFLMGLVPAAVVWSGFLLWLGYFGGRSILATVSRLEGDNLLKGVSIGLVVCAASIWVIRVRFLGRRNPATVEENAGGL